MPTLSSKLKSVYRNRAITAQFSTTEAVISDNQYEGAYTVYIVIVWQTITLTVAPLSL
jgi:hypothetical protein